MVVYVANRKGTDGILVPLEIGFVEEIYSRLQQEREQETPKYGYFWGVKLTSEMSEDEIYSQLYGSKENFLKIYPEGQNSYSGIKVLQEERIKRMIEHVSSEYRPEFEEVLTKRKDDLEKGVASYQATNIDSVASSLILALDSDASFEDIEWLLLYWGNSASSYNFYYNYVTKYANRGAEFKNYLKKSNEIDNSSNHIKK